MPNKRSKRKRTVTFYCPYCQERLWRKGGKKYHLFYRDASEIQKHLDVSYKKAQFIASRNSCYTDQNTWIEEFHCQEHSTIWLLLSKREDGTIARKLAQQQDWSRTGHTINPEFPNPSVSEFSYSMSKRASIDKIRRFK